MHQELQSSLLSCQALQVSNDKPIDTFTGGITGAIEISITYPTEYVKTVMQLNHSMAKKGVVGVFKHTYNTNGFFALYKGYSALLLFSVPKNYVRFSGFTYAKNNLFTKQERLHTLACGLFAGAAESTFVVTPQETLKTKLVHDKMQENHKYKNLFHGIYTIVKENGLGGMYKGYTATLIKQSSNQGIRFLVFNDTTRVLQKYSDHKATCDFFAGGFAGFCSTMANNPVDVIKTKMQGIHAHEYNGFLDCGNKILHESGPMGFYHGVVPRLCRVCLDVALTFSIYGALKRHIQVALAKLDKPAVQPK